MIYFGKDMEQFREILPRLKYVRGYTYDGILRNLDAYIADGGKIDLVIRTVGGYFDGWNCSKSVGFYNINFDTGTCRLTNTTVIDASRRTVKIL